MGMCETYFYNYLVTSIAESGLLNRRGTQNTNRSTMDISVYCQPINMPKRGDTTIIQSHCQSPRTHLQCFCQFPTCIHSFLHSSFLLSFTPSFIPTLPIHYSSAILSLTHTHDTQIHFFLCRSINFLTIKTYFKACYTQNALLSSPKLDCRDAISKHPKL